MSDSVQPFLECGNSSVGRAAASQAAGHGFEPRLPLTQSPGLLSKGMSIVIASILIISLFFIATEQWTNVNKSAVAVFACTLGWVLYISFGADFVGNLHANDYAEFLNGIQPNSIAVKHYIAQNVFVPYVGRAAEIVLFLMATMGIVSILHINGCFDFLTLWIRTHNSKLLLWKLTAISFIISANLDNISTIVLMLTVTNIVLPRTRDRMLYGAMVLIAVIFGGAMTVIGDPTGLVLWNQGLITATGYTKTMALPCLLAWIVPTIMVSLRLPETVEVEHPRMPYRGDDTNMRFWQRGIMFVVAIGGLWFIPSFAAITKLPPFLGAFCVLSLLWVVNEIFNHKLFSVTRRFRADDTPQRMMYNTIQQILYIVGVLLAVGVVIETGAIAWASERIDSLIGNVWIVGIMSGAISVVLDSFASCITMVSLHDVSTTIPYYAVDGAYWKVLSFATSAGGSILAFGSISGVVYMQREGVSLSWYFKHVTPLAIIGGGVGFIVLCLELI